MPINITAAAQSAIAAWACPVSNNCNGVDSGTRPLCSLVECSSMIYILTSLSKPKCAAYIAPMITAPINVAVKIKAVALSSVCSRQLILKGESAIKKRTAAKNISERPTSQPAWAIGLKPL